MKRNGAVALKCNVPRKSVPISATLLPLILSGYALCACNVSVDLAFGGPTYTVSATVVGLVGQGLTLDNAISVAPDAVSVPDVLGPLFPGQTYDVTVTAQPVNPSQTCVVSNGMGTITNANVTNVEITCTTNAYTVGGRVTGLIGSGLVLLDNASDPLSVAAAGAFTFATPVLSGMPYDVTISSQPTHPAQICTVSNPTGSGTVTNSDITTVSVVC